MYVKCTFLILNCEISAMRGEEAGDGGGGLLVMCVREAGEQRRVARVL